MNVKQMTPLEQARILGDHMMQAEQVHLQLQETICALDNKKIIGPYALKEDAWKILNKLYERIGRELATATKGDG